MEKITKNNLNEFYKKHTEKAEKLNCELSKIFKTRLSYDNKNYENENGEWVCYYFPIPVIEIDNKFGLNISLFEKPNYIEFFTPLNKIKSLNLEKLIKIFNDRNLNIYGGDNCLIDFYEKNKPIDKIKTDINNCLQKSVGICFETSNTLQKIQKDIKDLITCFENE